MRRTFPASLFAGLLAIQGCGGDGAMSHRDPNDPTNWNLHREDIGDPEPPPDEGCVGEGYTKMSLQLVEELGLTVEEWRQVQFYAGGRVLIRRGADSTEVEVTEAHTIRRLDDKIVDEVLLECLTPGVLLEVDERGDTRSITVAFDPDAPESGLVFEASPEREDFCLAVSSPPERSVAYEGKAYEPVEVKSCLLIKTESAEDLRKQQRQLKGIQLE